MAGREGGAFKPDPEKREPVFRKDHAQTESVALVQLRFWKE
jgi:hypothetical protein